MTRPDFYRALEDRFRGSAQVIEARLSVYLPFVRPIADAHRGATLTDIGCGRGEWLALLQRTGIEAQGVDKDEGMLAACREQGLRVDCADAIGYLQRLPDASQFAVSAFHFVEHLPFDTLHVVASEIMRVLRPGGLLIFETPNPESLTVSTGEFYLDPSHNHPIPPELLAFLVEFHGFADVKTLRLQERRDLSPEGMSVRDVLTGASPDYAVIGRKPGGEPPTQEIAAYGQEYGVTLQTLAIDYDIALRTTLARSRERLEAAHALAASADAAARDAHRSLADVWGEFPGLKEQLASIGAQLAAVQGQQATTEAHLRAVLQSRSWRLTAPIRWFGHKVRAVRNALLS
jgi:O-antigen chain-terminating methyltransferase